MGDQSATHVSAVGSQTRHNKQEVRRVVPAAFGGYNCRGMHPALGRAWIPPSSPGSIGGARRASCLISRVEISASRVSQKPASVIWSRSAHPGQVRVGLAQQYAFGRLDVVPGRPPHSLPLGDLIYACDDPPHFPRQVLALVPIQHNDPHYPSHFPGHPPKVGILPPHLGQNLPLARARQSTSTLVVCPKRNPPKNAKTADRYVAFITNIRVNNAWDLLRYIPKTYRKRWGIETGYRILKQARIKSPRMAARLFLMFFFAGVCQLLAAVPQGADQ